LVNQTRIRSIVRHLTVLNFLLFAITAVFASYVLPSLLNLKISYTPPAPKKIVEGKEEKAAATQSPSAMEYTIVAEQNVFNPERKIPAEKKNDEKLLPKPEFVLYGTVINSDTSIAFIEDKKAPFSSQGRGKRQQVLHLGGTLSGYTLKELYPDRVVMLRGEDRLEITVLNSAKSRSSDTSTVASTQVPTAQATQAATAPPRMPPSAAQLRLQRHRQDQPNQPR